MGNENRIISVTGESFHTRKTPFPLFLCGLWPFGVELERRGLQGILYLSLGRGELPAKDILREDVTRMPYDPTDDDLTIRTPAGEEEMQQCARLMAGSDPWITLRRSYEDSFKMLHDPTREVYVAACRNHFAGFMILQMHGTFRGYIQTIAILPEWRNRRIGTRLVAFAEERIFSETPNVFICVSSFNPRAKELYLSLGYDIVGELKDFIVAGHSEILLRKTIAPLAKFGIKPEGKGMTEEDIIIRPFRWEDQAEVLGLWENCGLIVPQNDPQADIRRKCAFQPELFLVGQGEHGIVATVMAGYEGHRGWINYLAVTQQFRHRGIGGRMMQEAEKKLRVLGCAKINLQVRSTNTGVIEFYKKIGFGRDDVISLGKRLGDGNE